jgi:oligopeptide transport system ATP-binding protein
MSDQPLLRVENLVKYFPVNAGLLGRVVAQVRAVDGVSFEIEPGSTLGLVGESGCGKSTIGQTLLHLLEPTSGRVVFDGLDLGTLSKSELRAKRRDLQIIFQDPFNSLNPRKTVSDIVGEAMRVHGLATRRDVEAKVAGILERVGIPAAWMNRYPHEFSGGQRQRISIARAIALRPKLIVCDEAVSALDVSIQAQIINLLIDLREEMGLSFLFISHDLSVVKHISDRIAVMYLGRIVESAPAERLFASPAHPYTRALLSAIPVPDPSRQSERIVLQGDVPTPLAPPSGCHFHTRCPAAMPRCSEVDPPVIALPGGQSVRCLLAEGVSHDDDWYDVIKARTREAERENQKSANPTQDARPAIAGAASGDTAGPIASLTGGRPVDTKDRIEDGLGLAARAALAALMGLGLLGVASIPIVGPLLALASFWLLVRPFTERKGAWTGAVIATLVVFGLGSDVYDSARKQQLARVQIVALQGEIERVVELKGSYPESLSELGWRLPDIVGGVQATDPWGGAWRYRAPTQDEGTFWLGSHGPDGRPGGGDDIGRLPVDASESSS